MSEFAVADVVDIRNPDSRDNILVEMQPHGAKVAAVTDSGYMVTPDAGYPPDRQFGPFPPARLGPNRAGRAHREWHVTCHTFEARGPPRLDCPAV